MLLRASYFYHILEKSKLELREAMWLTQGRRASKSPSISDSCAHALSEYEDPKKLFQLDSQPPCCFLHSQVQINSRIIVPTTKPRSQVPGRQIIIAPTINKHIKLTAFWVTLFLLWVEHYWSMEKFYSFKKVVVLGLIQLKLVKGLEYN